MLELLPQQLANGLALGSTYALVAMGLTLIFGVLLIPNFAHGELYMLGGFLTYAGVTAGLDFWLAAVLATVLVMGLGVLVDRITFKPLEQASGLSLMISALAMSIVLQQIATITWGTEPRTIPNPVPGILRTPFASLTYHKLLIIAVMVLGAVGLWAILNRTRLGLSIRAVSQNRDAALLMGIEMWKVRAATFAIGAAFGALAGALLGAAFPIYPTMGVIPVLKALVVLVLGGIGSIPGAILGGLLLGVAEVLIAGYISSELQDIGAFVILVAMLLVRPQGLFGRAQIER
ncbi:branched-chain amino acid ABC transporter permease [Paralimibaculum aggregatum]|uniref:Branched-chain amino acid ABC transporter permease n=1 Tax=Paralimibaculum aggregatum TaxID=3036245 RepID=A0ABQ6LTL4_9RHOB|nr:branched-chain amino acid ABC transporter permease [Limibaculum sp. NKW23]GMG85392.1 branched-chain amino acid ABC transporter permease [Limibaculum sp. NKW23]